MAAANMSLMHEPFRVFRPKKLNEKKGGVGLWQCSSCVPSALLLNALNFALNFFLFVPAFFNISCKHYRTNDAKILIPSN